MDAEVQKALSRQHALILNLVFALVKSGAVDGEALAKPLEALANAADSRDPLQAQALRTMAQGARGGPGVTR